MRYASPKRAAKLRERAKRIATMEPTSCPRCHRAPADDIHERVRRSQYADAVLDESTWIPLCRGCHDSVTFHPTEQDYVDGWIERGSDWRRRAVMGDSMPDMPNTPDEDETVIITLRIPKSLREEIDARRVDIQEPSRNAWLERVCRWALRQPINVESTEERT